MDNLPHRCSRRISGLPLFKEEGPFVRQWLTPLIEETIPSIPKSPLVHTNLVEVEVIDKSPLQPFNPPLIEPFGPILSEVMTIVGQQFSLFHYLVTMSNRSGSSIILQHIPLSPGTQGRVSITLPMQFVSTLVLSHTTTSTSSFLIWGTSLVPSFSSIPLPSVSPLVASPQPSISTYIVWLQEGRASNEYIVENKLKWKRSKSDFKAMVWL